MKFVIKQNVLSNALSKIQRCISQKALQDVLSNVYIEAGDDYIILKAHDHKLGSEIKIEANVVEKDTILVNANLLYDFVRKLPSGNVYFETNANGFLTIKSENAEIKLVTADGSTFPQLPRLQISERLEVSSLVLKDMLKLTIFAASLDEKLVHMNSTLLEVGEDKLTMVSCELQRIAVKETYLKNELSDEARRKYLLPLRASNELYKILQQVEDNVIVGINLSDKMIEFTIENLILTTQLMDKSFIEYRKILPTTAETKIRINKKQLHDAIDKASLLVKMKDENSIIFSIRDNVLSVLVNVAVGNFREDIPIQLEGKDLDIGFNPKYIMDVLKVLDCEEIEAVFNTAIRPAIVRSVDDENYTYLVLPLKI